MRGFYFLLTVANHLHPPPMLWGFFHAPKLPFFVRFDGLSVLGNTLYHFAVKTP